MLLENERLEAELKALKKAKGKKKKWKFLDFNTSIYKVLLLKSLFLE